MHLLKRKETYAVTIFVALLSVSILLPGKQWSTKIGTLVQALAVSALVGVTIFYANQAKRLVDESIKDREEMVKKRNADFWERTIIEFYRPLINKINNLSDFLRMKQIATDELNKVTEDVLEFWNKKRYMVYKELAEESGMLIVEFIGAAVDQSPESKTKYFESEKKLKIIIVEEWKKTEDRIREVYELKG